MISNFKGSCQFFERSFFSGPYTVGAMPIAILGELIKPRQQFDDCGRRIRILPSLHDKTSKPQIQQQGAHGDLRGTFCCSARYILTATCPECELPSWLLSLRSAERSRYKPQTSCLATLEGRGVSCLAVLESC